MGIIAQFPHFLVHPATRRAFLKADAAVEGVHGLMLHLPTAIASLDEIDDPGLVALIRVVIHAESVAELVEGDLLRIAEAGVENLEARSIRLEPECRALVRVTVFFAFLGEEGKAAVADRAVDATVRAEGEAIEIKYDETGFNPKKYTKFTEAYPNYPLSYRAYNASGNRNSLLAM